MPVGSFDENHRPEISALDAPEELSQEDEEMQTPESESLALEGGDAEPRVNKILRHVRNVCGLSGGGLVGLITVANPDDSPAGKIAQTAGGVGILLAIAGVGAGTVLALKQNFWDNRGTRQHNSTYEGEQY